MIRQTVSALLIALWSATAPAGDRITKAQIREVMAASDAAASVRDAAAVGVYLGKAFERVIQWPYKELMATVRLDKTEYLQLIDEGWVGIGDYDYRRDDVDIFIRPDGLSGQSNSTLTEHMVVDGVEMTSRFREYAVYEIEDGRAVITRVSGHTLLGDSTPE